MKTIFLLIVVVSLGVGCKGHDKNTELPVSEDFGSNQNSAGTNTLTDSLTSGTSTYTWTSKEKQKFLDDCKKQADTDATDDEVNNFCSCMLNTCQKYYSSYAELEKKNDEERENKVVSDCLPKQ